MAYRAQALDVLPEVESLAAEVLTKDELQEVDLVARRLLGGKDERRWAIAKATLQVGLDPSRPLMYWSREMQMLPRNTRNCIRYLGDYMDMIVKETTNELIGGDARRNSLGKNARLLARGVPSLSELANKLMKYSDFLYTPGKHDFSLPAGRSHRFTGKEVVLTCYLTAALAKQILAISKAAKIAVEKDNLYILPNDKWGSPDRVLYAGDPLERQKTMKSDDDGKTWYYDPDD